MQLGQAPGAEEGATPTADGSAARGAEQIDAGGVRIYSKANYNFVPDP